MSHFTVMVVTEGGLDSANSELERLLDPFNENDEVAPYWDHEADSFETWWYREYYIKEGKAPADVTFPVMAEYMRKHNNEEYRQAPDGSIERQTTYNPDSKWDWYQVGGRWRGALPIKPEADGAARMGERSWANEGEEDEALTADQALKQDIDLDRARKSAMDHAEMRWDIVEALVAKHGTPKTIDEIAKDLGIDWEDRGLTQDERKVVRDAYWAQPTIKAAKASSLLDGWFASWDESYAGHTRESYVEMARLSAVSSYAFLSEETGWIAPGRMGWFGMSTDEREDRLEYYRKVEQVLDALPDDAVISMVDCHI